MFLDTLERVNRLRQQAMNNPEFIQSAKQHEETLQQVERYFEPRKYRKTSHKHQKSLADIYDQANFGERSDDVTH
ncbi:hypothetical protein KSS82_12640 [Vibrio mimicus]|uniref:hypothetical protein n=1 Tax=Vibrio sp. RC586 TaxID=675815 RepID=UPI0001BB834B|nr:MULTISPECIES: hypothetical protein [Vibrio]EEY98176.1 hypothetical protein VOA_001994 [Vibrio sp. RC586]QXC58871.1 hypothetical protein KSS82_12640 [Vibrio mimicus]